MTLTILDDSMSSDHTPHIARRVPGRQHVWEVSWLPGQHLDRNSAITAMVLADLTSSDDIDVGHRLWPHIEGWAAELGLTAPDALAATATPPVWSEPDKAALPADPEAAD
jgi:hypothetical protein